MAAHIALVELSDREQVRLLFGVLGAIGAWSFGALCWLVKLAISREMARHDGRQEEREQWETDQNRFREWVRTMFILHGWLPQPKDPNGDD